jgi:hypothetical protein
MWRLFDDARFACKVACSLLRAGISQDKAGADIRKERSKQLHEGTPAYIAVGIFAGVAAKISKACAIARVLCARTQFRRPRRPDEDTMEGAEVGIAFAPEDTPRRCAVPRQRQG